ncbi:polymer-forming cytoskeletal protein [Kamptonema cortianum]|nr:polymer-forming cytoskeletal protein [Oscillatoria laete-virens]MDK3157906.1 polymer-forming cytoskeletal protein [Kamptonema cortianum]MDL5046036.1 polymer-forming cytoskeletal protein [Oscillatoria amoena NRMC-F 0135]MDL5052744.1 polymer-forming cytoskeletal protein [Oscillatoria laete-virens NRMC-F 0139]
MGRLLSLFSAKTIDVICPHCGAHQSEPKHCISTTCKSCGGYFTPKTAQLVGPEQKKRGKKGKRTVECFSCRGKVDVAGDALSTVCHHCGYDIDINDHSIMGICSRDIETKGHLHVGVKGRLVSARVAVGSADIRGKVSTKDFSCEGVFELHPSATFFGHLQAETLKVMPGATFHVDRSMEVRNAEIYGKVKGKMIVTGRVYLAETAQVDGDIVAAAVDAEPGAAINGYVNIRSVQKVDFQNTPISDNGQGKEFMNSAMTA